MANIVIAEGSGRLETLYGKYQAPITSCIEDVVEAWKVKEIGPKIFRQVKSENWAEAFTSVTAASDWQVVGENGAHPTNGFEEGYPKTIVNQVWKSQIAISRELCDDNKIGEMTKRARKLTDSFYRTRERFFANLLGTASQGSSSVTVNGFSFDCGSADGKCLFAKDHPAKVSGPKQTNMYSDAFSEEALGAAMTAMQNLKGDNGETLGLEPDTIIIPNIASLKKSVFSVLGSYGEPGTANNDFNYLFGSMRVLVWPYLNDYIGSANTAPWFLMDSSYNEQCDGAVWLDRVDCEITSRLGANDENIWDGYARLSAGFVDWRFILGGGLSGGSEL